MVLAMPPLLCVAIVVFLEVVCLGAVFPTLPRYTEALGGTALLAGVMFALVSGPKIFTNPLWGKASDASGRRRILVLLTIGTLSGSVLWAATPWLGATVGLPLLWLGLSRLVYGIFSGQATLAFAVASDTSAPEKRSAALGVLGAAFGAGLTVGFPLGGIVAEAFGYAAVGWLCAAAEVIALLVVLLTLPETRRRDVAELTVEQAGRLITRPVIMLLVAVCLVVTMGMSMMTPTLSPYVGDVHGWSVAEAGWAFLVFGIVSIIVQGGLIRPTVRALGDRRTLIVGVLTLAAGFVVLAVLAPVGWFWLGVVLIGTGAGLSQPTLAGLFSLNVDAREQGAAHGLNQGATSLGRTLAYPIAGGLYGYVGWGWPYAVGAVLLGAGLLPLAALRRVSQPDRLGN